MISVSDEIKLRADIAANLYKTYLEGDFRIGNSPLASCIENADIIVDKAIEKSLGIKHEDK